jgi:molybdopterin synthase catalytic subunit
MADLVRFAREPLEIGPLTTATPADGAVCLFVGVVRDQNAERKVLSLEYEAYEEMALPLMQEIAAEAKRAFSVTEVRLLHRLGRLEIGEASVVVAVSSAHRAEAFAACRFAIDALKTRIPIWKKEFYADGSAWLESPRPASR